MMLRRQFRGAVAGTLLVPLVLTDGISCAHAEDVRSLPARAVADVAPVVFRAGDVVLSTSERLRLCRDGSQIAAWGTPGRIGADAQGRLWCGTESEGRIALRAWSSTAEFSDHGSQSLGVDVRLGKILHCGESLYVVYTLPHEEGVGEPGGTDSPGKIRGRWIHVLPFSLISNSFGKPIPLRDFFGLPEIVVRSRELVDGRPFPKGARETVLEVGLYDATMTPSGTLWISSQGKITSYMIAGLPAGLLHILNPATITGYGQRSGKIDWWISRHGNNTGLAAVSEDEILVVNGNPPGWITAVKPTNPEASVPLIQNVFGSDPQVWGLGAVLPLTNEVLVAHRSATVAKVYRVSKATKNVVGTLAEGVIVQEMVEIRGPSTGGSG